MTFLSRLVVALFTVIWLLAGMTPDVNFEVVVTCRRVSTVWALRRFKLMTFYVILILQLIERSKKTLGTCQFLTVNLIR